MVYRFFLMAWMGQWIFPNFTLQLKFEKILGKPFLIIVTQMKTSENISIQTRFEFAYICSSICSTYFCWTASFHSFFNSSRRHRSSCLQECKFSLTVCIFSRDVVTCADTWLNNCITCVKLPSCLATKSFSLLSVFLNSFSIFSFSRCRSSFVSLASNVLITVTRRPLPLCKKNRKSQI